MQKIQLLPIEIIQQIAAGEVIQNPSSIVKELLENSLDANATNIELSLRNGGKSFISVLDNGEGISQEDLPNALTKHATSKLNHHNLYNITSLGFRGEALYSIAYMSKFTIKSKAKTATNSYKITSANNKNTPVELTNLERGTYIEVRDLFFNIPARLKFLKSDNSEANAVYKVLDSIALAYPQTSFKLFNHGKKIIDYPSTENNPIHNRLNQIINSNFIDNSLYFESNSADFKIYGYTSKPTYTVTNRSKQYICVNGRYIQEKQLYGIFKAAYTGLIESNRYPVICLFININPNLIDVNVNPNKSTVKFSNLDHIKSLTLHAIKQALSKSTLANIATQKANSVSSNNTTNHTYNPTKVPSFSNNKSQPNQNSNAIIEPKLNLSELSYQLYSTELAEPGTAKPTALSHEFTKTTTPLDATIEACFSPPMAQDNLNQELEPRPLGYAKAQYNQNWIIAESNQGLVIVDQHAAHERITKQKLYQQYLNKEVQTIPLLIPEIVEVSLKDLNIVYDFKDYLTDLGVIIDKFGDNAIIVREYPAILGKKINFKKFIEDLILDLKELNTASSFIDKLDHIMATISCHNSIRAGTNLTVTDMNILLRQIETTENASVCSHGRPTYTILSWQYIEKMFNRR